MAKLLVTYDLNAPGQTYKKVYNYLDSFDGRRALESVWFIETDDEPKVIRDELKEIVDKNDRVFVCKIGTWSSFRLMNDAGEWLNGKN